jgi:hypothetical protein
LQSLSIAEDRADLAIEHHLQAHGFCLGGRPHDLHRPLDDRREHHRVHLEPHLPRDDARDVEEVFDELRLTSRTPFDDLHTVSGSLCTQVGLAQ